MLEFTTNQFGNIIITTAALPTALDEFTEELILSLDAWTADGRKLVWLELPLEQSAYIHPSVQAGFVFHHSDKNYLMLTRQLTEDAFVPTYATHYIGAGGVVINPRNEVLVVVEKYRGSWGKYIKLPGGALYQGEHLADGVMREVLEETGVQTRFESLVCFRHWHGYRYGKSDIYFVCRLSPTSHDITLDEKELDECMWMPVEEYLKHELVSPFNRQIVQAAITGPGLTITQVEGYADAHLREFFMPK